MAPGIRTVPMTRSAATHLLLDVGAVRHHRGDVAAEDVVHVAQLGRIDVEDRDVRADADRDLAGARARDAGAEDDDLARPHAGRAGEQHAAAAVLRLQAPGADLDREATRDLAHRRQQRQRAVVELERLVGERVDAARAQHVGQRRVGREMQVGEQDQAAPQVARTPTAAAPSPSGSSRRRPRRRRRWRPWRRRRGRVRREGSTRHRRRARRARGARARRVRPRRSA